MGLFVSQVRNGVVRQPTQIGFKPELWRRALEALGAPDQEDADLLAAGLFFDEVFSMLRSELAKGRFHLIARRDRLMGLCALMNHDAAALRKKVGGRRKKAKGDKTVLVSEEIERTITLPSGIRVTPDQMLTAMLDSVVYPLDETLRATEDGEPLTDTSEPELRRAFLIANAYRIASDLWLDCLWNDCLVEQRPNGDAIIRPRDAHLARQAAIAEHRYQLYVWQLFENSFKIWRNHLTLRESGNLPLSVQSQPLSLALAAIHTS